MTETQWRFLQAITERVAPSRIVELRLFPSIRQGGVESGVAVVAAAGPDAGGTSDAADAPIAAPGSAPDQDDRSVRAEREIGLQASVEPDGSIGADASVALDGLDFPDLRQPAEGMPIDLAALLPDAAPDDLPQLGAAAPDGLDPLPQADGDGVPATDAVSSESPPEMHPGDATGEAGLDALPALHGAGEAAVSAPRHVRYQVLAARYRLTLKGPDRGRWQFDLTHEADAPLETIERVARGVARRAGDDGEPELYAADAIGTILAQPWWSPNA